ncbi:MORN repeat-containing protein [Paenibacillus flagellatus]|uniref:Antitoxin component YwqK of the YwqJK toxin-antitoxin module n=1 Tax=Paenibacillus flagellatus TaxID=2211139 RepID=A0A2V5KYS4_9BACL|nr:hypothetical protein [Paenibacillus flagellatus]PYI55176.1 hypothetical protein DLM86_11665 [Paenibacillus flagellatus]
MAFNPVKTLETVFKPIVSPMAFKLLKPLREAKKLPGILIKKFQAAVKTILGTKETSLRNYVAIGSYYVSKRLLVVIALIILALVYFLFVKPPAFVNKWFNRVPVVVENTPKAMTFSGNAKVVDTTKKQPRYVGGLADGLYMGAGKLYDETGVLRYEGEFDKGLKHGAGTLYDDKGHLVYKGQFAADRYNGSGTLFSSDRRIRYVGEFQNGKFGGAGKLYDELGGLLYEGAFLEGTYHGAGKLFGANGQVAYEGEFAAGEFNGSGKAYDAQARLLYEGAFKNGRYSGEGTEYYADKGLVKYKGTFAAGAYAGTGELYDDKGVLRFKGTFRNGVLAGQGEAFDEAGKPSYKGEFADGQYQGIGTLFDRDGGVVLKSYFDKGRVSLQSFIGLPSKKVEELLGKPGEVALLDQPQPLTEADGAASTADGAPSASDADGAGSAEATAAAPPPDAASAGAASGNPAASDASAATAAGLKFQMIYPDLQYTFLVETSKSNPKEAVVTELSVWGSKPLSALQPAIETFKPDEKTNAEGFAVLELQSPMPGGLTVNRYYRGDYLYSLTFFAGNKSAHRLDIVAIERIRP